jgi:predicted enzyme related to lactoylglutathione lyase
MAREGALLSLGGVLAIHMGGKQPKIDQNRQFDATPRTILDLQTQHGVGSGLICANSEDQMQKVLGFGGFFFRAKDPKDLADWYLKHLGINLVPAGPESAPWMQEAGPTIFSPFADDTDYFASDKAFMLNFRVADLAGMVAQLQDAEIEISHQQTMDGIGQFARIHDPAGNPVELWQPA